MVKGDKMQISKNIQQELVILLQQGYSIDSICKAMGKKYKNVEFKKSDIFLIAKKNNIKVGSNDLTKEKIDLNTAKNMMPELLKNNDLMGQVKSKLILVFVCILVLLGAIGFLAGWKIALYVGIGVLVLIGIAVGISYFKFVKPNKAVRDAVKSNLRQKK
jgi:hypothetical protein